MPRVPAADPPARRARRGVALVVVATVVLGLLAGPATAQDGADLDAPKTKAEHEAAVEALEKTLALAPEDQPASPDDPFQDVVDTQKDAAELASARLEATTKSDAANVA